MAPKVSVQIGLWCRKHLQLSIGTKNINSAYGINDVFFSTVHAFGSLNFYSEHSKFTDLLNSIRSKCQSCASWPDPAKAIRASLVCIETFPDFVFAVTSLRIWYESCNPQMLTKFWPCGMFVLLGKFNGAILTSYGLCFQGHSQNFS